jgi:CheY-like chemotaxis protein
LVEQILRAIHVLCVDDNQDALDLLTIVLSRHGAQVTACRSAECALRAIGAAKFDVIISDLSMPGMDGYDLAHALRRLEKIEGGVTTPTLAVSGNADQPSAKRRFADFQVYLTKPYDSLKLAQIVERLAEADGESVKAGSLEVWERERKPK